MKIVINQLRTFRTAAFNYKEISPGKLKRKVKGVSSHEWLARQNSDPYVEKAKMLNYRCRSAFKLIEIDDRFKILRPGYHVVDCGASPGSWTQVTVKRVNSDASDKSLLQGKVISVDRQLIYPIEGATLIGNADFTDPTSEQTIIKALNGNKCDAVISDMAPNATGIRDLDNENIIKLCYMVLKFAITNSKVGASVLMKLWQCGDSKKLELDIGKFYEKVNVVKPKSSRSDSTEMFLLGREFKGLKNS
ncbi:rRNA methyltransferase 2, mitochondrial [Sitophilus oryzae]|uniref:rRNA methyltransferase 2, mitochondrial n=1 Tax=Sitophilus oryzae TaxID=7048 RepID=A0A6J2Y4G8_SITOR|nr:rRNA methyltransferase 2, mitochondrial [Sitophilus oryzae]